MLFGSIFLIILYLVLQYILAWITFFNNLDSRLGDSTWRFSYDYPVVGDRDISDLDDKDFVRLRRKKNKIVLLMYSIVLIMFIASLSLLRGSCIRGSDRSPASRQQPVPTVWWHSTSRCMICDMM